MNQGKQIIDCWLIHVIKYDLMIRYPCQLSGSCKCYSIRVTWNHRIGLARHCGPILCLSNGGTYYMLVSLVQDQAKALPWIRRLAFPIREVAGSSLIFIPLLAMSLHIHDCFDLVLPLIRFPQPIPESSRVSLFVCISSFHQINSKTQILFELACERID